MKAIITGITGQDGSYLAELLLSKNYDVVGIARRCSTENTQRIEHVLPHIKLIEGDVTDYGFICNLVQNEQADEIYNLAAMSHVGTSFSQPSYTWDVVAKGPMYILEAILHSSPMTRMYQASSSEMFGRNFSMNTKGKRFQNEHTPFRPQSPYAVAKCAAHHTVALYRDAYALKVCSGLLFNHESPRRGDNFVTKKITKWAKERFIDKTRNDKLSLGNINSYRDWGYALDYVEAMWLMLQQDEMDDFVIGTGTTYTVKYFLEEVLRIVGEDYKDIDKYIYIDPELFRPAEVDYLRADPSYAKEVLGWEPKVSFEQLVELMLTE